MAEQQIVECVLDSHGRAEKEKKITDADRKTGLLQHCFILLPSTTLFLSLMST
jgi:hypothetical protein